MKSSLPRLAPFLLAALVAGAVSRADAGPAASASANAGAAPLDLPPASELPKLPELQPIRLGEVEPEAKRDLDTLLAELTSDKEDIRDRARAAIADVSPTLVPAIHARIEEIHGTYDKKALPLLLEDARKAARAKRKSGKVHDDAPAPSVEPKKKPKKKHKKGGDKDKSADADKPDQDKAADKADPKDKAKDRKAAPDDDGDLEDWLAIALDAPRPDDETWKHLVELLAMERMLTAIGTTPAVMELVAMRASFGDTFRIDIQRLLDKLGDKAVAGLIESRNHKASVVRDFAERELDKMGRSIPGEAVASDDPDILADVLRAFGHTRDVDAVRVALSYANSDRKKLRDAAREAVAGIGDAGKWQLREAYQDLTGDKPDKSASWDLLAKQIFATYDRARLAAFDKLVHDGMAAKNAGNHTDAVVAFDQILAEDPLFDDRKSMAPSYAAVAAALPAESGEEKLALYRKALRLDPGSADAKKIESQISLTEAKLLIHDHRPDRFLLERAAELDPTNQEAKDLLASFEEKAVEKKETSKKRYEGAAAIFAGMLAGVLAIGLWPRKKKKNEAGSAPSNQPGGGPARPEQGWNRPEPGPDRPESGSNHLEPGPDRPESGSNHLEPGAERSETGSNHREPGPGAPERDSGPSNPGPHRP